jgi:hypothetical protein
MRRRPASALMAARAGSLMVFRPAAAAELTPPAYQCLARVRSAEHAQSRQAARATQLVWWFPHGRLQLGRSAGRPRFAAQLGLWSEIESATCRRSRMQPRLPVARMSALRLVSARVMLLRVTAMPVEATWGISARMTAKGVKAVRTMLTQARAALTLVPAGVLPSRVERPGQAQALPSMCGERSLDAAQRGIRRAPLRLSPRK